MALVTLIQSVLLTFVALPALAEEIRYVPQLGLTELFPRHVSFQPDDPETLMVVNESGRIDLLDVSNPERPVKMLAHISHSRLHDLSREVRFSGWKL